MVYIHSNFSNRSYINNKTMVIIYRICTKTILTYLNFFSPQNSPTNYIIFTEQKSNLDQTQ